MQYPLRAYENKLPGKNTRSGICSFVQWRKGDGGVRRSLSDYGEFIAEVRACSKSMNLNKAVRAAVKNCIGRGILVDFLTRHGSEVENMLLTEWNMKDALAVS
ncbi:MAG: hypothetical protein FWC26_04085, partial [Fibromonadales bacterium]|nr:hypothetical protein [Fibromonadales bacterium]